MIFTYIILLVEFISGNSKQHAVPDWWNVISWSSHNPTMATDPKDELPHSFDLHSQMLDLTCRVCAKRALLVRQKRKKAPKVHYVKSYAQKILDYYNIDTSTDIPTMHPDKICTPCYTKMLMSKRNPTSTVHQMNRMAALDINEHWVAFKYEDSVANCLPCSRFVEQRNGGRPKTVKNTYHLPFNIAERDLFDELHGKSPYIDTTNLILANANSSQIENETCQICKCIFPLRIVFLPKCEHMFCSVCLSTVFKTKLSESVPCPTCRTETMYQTICKPNRQILNRIRDLMVICIKCGVYCSLETMAGHQCSTSNTLVATKLLPASAMRMESMAFHAPAVLRKLPPVLHTPATLSVAPQALNRPVALGVAPSAFHAPAAFGVATPGLRTQTVLDKVPLAPYAPAVLGVGPPAPHAPAALGVAPPASHAPAALGVAPPASHAPVAPGVTPPASHAPAALGMAPPASHAPAVLGVAPQASHAPAALGVAPPASHAPVAPGVTPPASHAPAALGMAPPASHAPAVLGVAPPASHALVALGVAPPASHAPVAPGVTPPTSHAPAALGVAPPASHAPAALGVAPPASHAPAALGVAPPASHAPIAPGVTPPASHAPAALGMGPPASHAPTVLGVAPPASHAPAVLGVVPRAPHAPAVLGVAPPAPHAPAVLGVAPPAPHAPAALCVAPPASHTPAVLRVAPPAPHAPAVLGVAPPAPHAPVALCVAPPASHAPATLGVAPPASHAPAVLRVAPPVPQAPAVLGVAPPAPHASAVLGVAPPPPNAPAALGVAPPAPHAPAALSVAPPAPHAPAALSVAPPAPHALAALSVAPPAPHAPAILGVAPPAPYAPVALGVASPSLCASATLAVVPPAPVEFLVVSPSTQNTDISNSTESAIKDILQKTLNTPLSPLEERLLTHSFRRKLSQAKSDIIKLRTGGQSIAVQRLVKARKSSSLSRSPLKKKRARLLEKGRKYLSGEGNTATQMSSEIKRIPLKLRTGICSKAGVKRGAHISKHLALAMKSHVGLTWNQRRRLQSVLKTIGITQESENKQRDEKRTLLGDHLEAKSIHFEFREDNTRKSTIDSISVRPAPIVFIKDIKSFLFERLNSCAENGMLDWHRNEKFRGLPGDKIYVKVGGDKGRGSMKICLQICNVQHCNSPENTLILCIFEGNDTYANLAIALDGIAQQLENLDGCFWGEGPRRKQIVLVGSGDYDFLAKVTGIAGASGSFPCLYCKISRNQLQLPPNERPMATKRTITDLNNDYMNFVSIGQLNQKHQSRYNNVINPALLHLEPERYCIPYLHCLLGITKKHHDMQELACHELDIEIAVQKAESNAVLTNSMFDKFVGKQRKISKLETKLHNLQDRINDMNNESDDLTLAQLSRNRLQHHRLERKINAISTQLDSLKFELKLEDTSGPVTQNLEASLQRHNIQRQKYHGKSFVGNDCHKYLSPQVYHDICDSIISKTEEVTNNATIHQKARNIAGKFKRLWQLFATVHKMISHANFIEDDMIPRIHQAIERYSEYFRKEFPLVRFTLKQHLIEDHALSWIMEYQFGFGLFGEQGMESIHHKIHKLSDNHSGMINHLQRLKSTIEEHHLHALPSVKCHIPAVKKRKIW